LFKQKKSTLDGLAVNGDPDTGLADPGGDPKRALLALGHYRRSLADSHGASRFSRRHQLGRARGGPTAAGSCRWLQDRHGLEVDFLVSGPKEARLIFIWDCSRDCLSVISRTAILDIGAGSTELEFPG